MEEKSKNLYSSIDIAKFIFSICIVFLHTGVYTLFPYNLPYFFEKCILRLAVPFFFCVSGFLLREKLYLSDEGQCKKYIRKYVLRLLKPLIFFEFLNIILESIKMHMQGIDIEEIIINNIKHMCFYPYGALWYMQASLVGVIIAYPFIIKRKVNVALLIGGAGYLFSLLANSYYFLTDVYLSCFKEYIDRYLEVFISARNGIFVGFFMITLGMKTYDLFVRIKFERKILFAFAIFSYLLYFFEITILKGMPYADDGALFFFHILFIPILILNLVYCKLKTRKTIILRNLSTGIYLLHRVIISVLIIVEMRTGISFSIISSLIIVLGSCITICLVVYKTNWKFLKSLLK